MDSVAVKTGMSFSETNAQKVNGKEADLQDAVSEAVTEQDAGLEEENIETPERKEFRRKRVKRIKLILILLLIIFLLIPNILCGVLLYQLHKMNQNMEILREEIKLSQEEIERRTRESAAMAIEEQNKKEKEEYGTENLVQLHLTDEQKYPGKQLVYLTFDDGPSKYTNEILDILEKHEVKATFFVLAKEGYDAEYNRILAGGHTLGMHSYTHKYSVIYSSMQAYMDDVNSLSDFLTEHTGIKPKFYRFPGGSSNSVSKVGIQSMLHFLSDEGYVYYDWNVSSEDASPTMLEASVIAKNVLNGIGSKKEAVVLMHDAASKRSTVEALPIIIESLQQKGNVEILPITEGTNQIYHVKEKDASEINTDSAKEETVIEEDAVLDQAVQEAVSEAVSEELKSEEEAKAESEALQNEEQVEKEENESAENAEAKAEPETIGEADEISEE